MYGYVVQCYSFAVWSYLWLLQPVVKPFWSSQCSLYDSGWCLCLGDTLYFQCIIEAHHRLDGSSSLVLTATSRPVGKPKIRPPQNRNPWPDWFKIWHSWLHPWTTPCAKFYANSSMGASPQMGKIYAENFSFPFCTNSPKGQTPQRISACDGANDAVSHKGVSVGGKKFYTFARFLCIL